MERFYNILAYSFGGIAIFLSLACIAQLKMPLSALLIIFLCTVLYAFFKKKSRRLGGREKDINVSDVRQPFVLYLRSFLADETTRESAYFLTSEINEEESLVTVMEQIAPVYAIGDPKDQKMPLGARRIYVNDEHWKSTVRDLAHKAEVVVLRLGKTNSFWWEVEMALEEVPLNKLLFAIPVAESFSEVSALYKILMDKKIDIGDQNIGVNKVKMGSLSSFLYFDDNGKPHTSTVESPRVKLAKTYEEVLQKSLSDFIATFASTTRIGTNTTAITSTPRPETESNTQNDAGNDAMPPVMGTPLSDDKELAERLSRQAREQIKEQKASDPYLTDRLIQKAVEMKEGISTATEKIAESDAYNMAKEGLKDASKAAVDKAHEIKQKIEQSDAYHQTKDKAKDIGSLIADGLIKLGKGIKKKM